MAEVKGGEKLQAHLNATAAALGKGGTLKVGFLQGATYPNGTPVALVAAVQNFGAPSRNIPPRPFFSNMVRRKSNGWPNALAKNLKANGYRVEPTLRLMGEGIKGQLQQSIIDTNSPPLRPATVKRKGFDKPLIDTAHMLNSADYEVKA